MYAQNKTYLKDLPDLEELERGYMSGVGAGTSGPMGQIWVRNGQDARDLAPTPEKYQKFIRPTMKQSPDSGMGGYQQEQPTPQEFIPQYEAPIQSNTPTCREILDHVSNCPVCSKFFKFDNSVYIIALVILSIICILLLKKVLDL